MVLRSFRSRVLFLWGAFAFSPLSLSAQCLDLIKGPLIIDINQCTKVNPEAQFSSSSEEHQFIKDLDPQSKTAFFNTYRGHLIKGLVVKSSAKRGGIMPESSALSGQKITAFVPPGVNFSCKEIQKRVSFELKEFCCQGGGEAPCLLDTGYTLLNPQAVGDIKSSAGDPLRQKAKASLDVQKGDRFLKERNWKEANKHYLSAKSKGELDVLGHYKWAVSLRNTDQAQEALKALKFIQSKEQKKETWADEADTVRKALFLLARTYARLQDPGPSVMILTGYLHDSVKYKEELQNSLSHRDFGWIHTSREYRSYKKAAQQKLGLKTSP